MSDDEEYRALLERLDDSCHYALIGALVLFCTYVIAVTAYYQGTGIMRDLYWPAAFTGGSVVATIGTRLLIRRFR
jgi:hypothetical protein